MTAIAVSTTRSTKRNRVYVAPLRNPALVAILSADDGRATSKDIGITPAYALILEAQGLIRRVVVKPGEPRKPGRPPVVWALTDKGRKRARRAIGQ